MSSSYRTGVVVLIDRLADGIGGAERFAAALACALPSDRFDVTLCATRFIDDGLLADELDSAGVSRLVLGRRDRLDMLPLRRLAGFLRSRRIQVLHSHMFGSNIWGVVIGRTAGVPVIVAQEHSWAYEGDPLRKLLDGRVIGPLCTRFVAVSEPDRRRMVELEGVRAEKTLVVPTAYLPRPGAAAVGNLRAELGIPSDAPVVGTLAVLRPEKRLDELIAALQVVRERHPQTVLVIAGDGPEGPRLRELARRPSLEGSVYFAGRREDLATVLAGFDVAAMSSVREGMPLFVLEAMTHGVPLVATAVGGIPDVVEDGVSGLLVPPSDPGALGAAICRLLDDPGLRGRLSDAGRARATEFTIARVAERFADLYDSLLASS